MRRLLRTTSALAIIAAAVLGACAQATGAPPITSPAQLATAILTEPTVTPSAPPPTQIDVLKSKDPNTLVYEPFPGEPDTLDPAFDYETTGGGINENTYDTLIFYNRDNPNSFVSQLATEVPSQANGGISADGKTYTFKIRTGVKFHNGDPLTPADVAFTFQRGLLQGGVDSPQWLLF